MRRMLVVLGLVVATACNASTPEPDLTLPPTSAPLSSADRVLPPGGVGVPSCTVDGGRDTATTSPDGPQAFLTEVRFNETPYPEDPGRNCPRLVFEFEDAVPAYEVGYETGPFVQCGSGDPVDTSAWDAEVFLMIRLQPASGVDLGSDPYRETYAGPAWFAPQGETIKRIQRICDFEALLEWVVGLDDEHDFTVFTLEGPGRVVIDLSA